MWLTNTWTVFEQVWFYSWDLRLFTWKTYYFVIIGVMIGMITIVVSRQPMGSNTTVNNMFFTSNVSNNSSEQKNYKSFKRQRQNSSSKSSQNYKSGNFKGV